MFCIWRYSNSQKTMWPWGQHLNWQHKVVTSDNLGSACSTCLDVVNLIIFISKNGKKKSLITKFSFFCFPAKIFTKVQIFSPTKKNNNNNNNKSSYWICLEIQTLMICPFFLKSSKLKHDLKHFTKTFSYIYIYIYVQMLNHFEEKKFCVNFFTIKFNISSQKNFLELDIQCSKGASILYEISHLLNE
jgi:hypothetical protein